MLTTGGHNAGIVVSRVSAEDRHRGSDNRHRRRAWLLVEGDGSGGRSGVAGSASSVTGGLHAGARALVHARAKMSWSSRQREKPGRKPATSPSSIDITGLDQEQVDGLQDEQRPIAAGGRPAPVGGAHSGHARARTLGCSEENDKAQRQLRERLHLQRLHPARSPAPAGPAMKPTRHELGFHGWRRGQRRPARFGIVPTPRARPGLPVGLRGATMMLAIPHSTPGHSC